MRLLFVCSSSYVFGAEIVTLSLLEGLRDRGHDLMAAVGPREWSDGDFHDRVRRLGIFQTELALGTVSMTLNWKAFRWTLACIMRLPRLYSQFRNVKRDFKPDLVILTSPRHGLLLFPLLTRNRTLLHVHSGTTVRLRQLLLWRLIMARVQTFIAVSHFILKELQEIGVPSDRVAVIHNGILDRNFSPSAGGIDDLLRIVVVGQIAAWKGIEDVIAAAEILKQRTVAFKILVFGAGDASYVQQLRQTIERLELIPYFEWMGFVADRDEIYTKADICLIASRFEEPFGLVAVEAGAAAVPVVATRRGGLPEIIKDGTTGLLVEANSAAQIADAISTLHQNPTLRKSMGTSARAHVYNLFGRERMLDAFEALCRSQINC